MQHQNERRPATSWDPPPAADPIPEEDPGRMLVNALALSAVAWLLLAAVLGTLLLG
ncbi:MAG: hypothetical protein ACYC2O_05720 [Microthrixaceae bacterium]